VRARKARAAAATAAAVSTVRARKARAAAWLTPGAPGLRHRLLNLPAEPPTLWLNMGLWPGGRQEDCSFVDANERMAAELARLADWAPEHVVLGVGGGRGGHVGASWPSPDGGAAG
jgi:hypothetical protein